MRYGHDRNKKQTDRSGHKICRRKGEKMKVLEEGRWKMPWSMETTCSQKQCGAKLLVEEGDVRPIDYGNGFYAKCAICGTSVNIPVSALPLRMQIALNKKRKHSSSTDW